MPVVQTGNAPSRTRVLAAPHEPLRLAEQHGVLDGTRTPEQIVDLVRQAIAAGPPLSGNDVLFADVAADGVCACQRAISTKKQHIAKTRR